MCVEVCVSRVATHHAWSLPCFALQMRKGWEIAIIGVEYKVVVSTKAIGNMVKIVRSVVPKNYQNFRPMLFSSRTTDNFLRVYYIDRYIMAPCGIPHFPMVTYVFDRAAKISVNYSFGRISACRFMTVY